MNRSHLYNRSQSFHQEIRFALVLSQCFGVMPLHNVGKNVEDVQFKFLSLRFLYSLIHFGCVFATGVAAVVKMALHGFLIDETCKYYYIKPKVFCKNSLFQLLPVSIFSIRSPQFILCTLLGDGKKYWRNTLTLKCQWGIIIPVKMWGGETFWPPRSLCFLDSVSLINFMWKLPNWVSNFVPVEHILFIFTNLFHGMTCKNYKDHPVEIYFKCAFPQWFELVGYSHWAGAIVEVSSSSTITFIYW